MTERKKVSQRIEYLRTKILFLTQTDFALLLGMDAKRGRSTVNNWEQGVVQVKSEDLIKIAVNGGVSVDWLLGISQTPQRTESIQNIHSEIGLSGQAIGKLKLIAHGKDANSFPDLISALILDNNFEYFLSLYESIVQLEGKQEIICVDIAEKKLNLYADNHLKAVFQSQIVENIHNVSEIYKKLKGEQDNNGKR